MGLFTPAETTTAFLKLGMFGLAGSGKTYTATSIAIGMVELLREMKAPAAGKPIYFLDTEKGSDWVRPRIDAAGIKLETAKTRAFSDLLAAVPEAEAGGSVLLVDSLTHFWVELCETYCAKKADEYHRASYRLQFQDWAFLKAEWRKFTDRFVNSNVHVVLCGRAGFEYEYLEDEDTHKKQLERTGIKMKAESEMGYEPDLLVLMERKMNMETKKNDHVAHVVKDRSTLLDGMEIINPGFAAFLPHIRCLNLGGRQLGVDVSRTSRASIPTDKKDWNPIQREIAVDEISSLLVLHIPGQAAADKQRKVALIRKHFNNASWTEIEKVMPLRDLRAGFDALHIELEGKPSRYSDEPLPLVVSGRPEPKAEPADVMVADGLPTQYRRRKDGARLASDYVLSAKLTSEIPVNWRKAS